MQNKRVKFSLSTWFLLAFGILIILFGGLCILGCYFKTFSFNIVDPGSTQWSDTKEEAVRRKTFVADLITPVNPYKISNNRILYVKSGWIEKSWSGGFWYWTTNIDSSSNNWFEITLIRKKLGTDTTEWKIINRGKNNQSYGIQLQDDNNNHRLTGTLDDLPSSDTLRYTVLKRDTIDFHDKNIEGTLVLLLNRH